MLSVVLVDFYLLDGFLPFIRYRRRNTITTTETELQNTSKVQAKHFSKLITVFSAIPLNKQHLTVVIKL